MAFNSLMIRLSAELLTDAHASPSIIELGNQTFKPRGGIVREVERFLSGTHSSFSAASLEKKDGVLTSDYLKAIGYSSYTCIDVNDRYGALQMDLNESLATHYGYTDTFDVVTNNGTGEHIFDQASVFRNMHALAKDGGLLVNVLPFHNYSNHGFYCFQPCLFHDLAKANGYDLLRLSVASALGDEIAFTDSGAPRTTRPVKTLPLRDAILRTTAWPGWHDFNAAHLRRARAKLGSAIRKLAFKRANILVVAIMRKNGKAPFRYPIQGMYSGANISSSTIAEKYES